MFMTLCTREAVRILANQQAMIGALQHQARDFTRVQDVLDATHGA
jgi:hypothetical protein